MSTYLVCFIVCDFQYTKNTTNNGTEVSVYATPDRVNQTVYALSVAVRTLEEYQRLFNISYPLPKLDLIAIPDFVSGAMEHWGLITFREVNLLYDPAKTSEAGKQRVAVVVAHEVSHQWFGNLVTMAWWNDLWLNEGFATFMEYLGAESVEKDWEMMQQFITEESQPVMVTDAGVSSHPIIVNVNKPDEINEVFDAISYSKGAAVIRMLEAIIGKDKFFEGVSHYLKKHEWGNAVTDDLWQALSEVDGAHNVKRIMDTWTLQMGFPYVSLSFSTSANNNTIITATQTRFLADPGHQTTDGESPFKYMWYIVLDCLASSGGTNGSIMELGNATFLMDGDISDNNSSWLKCNLNQTGFYRVNYPSFMWKNLAVMLRDTPGKLSAADRSGLLDDAMSLARAGLLDYDVALEMTSYLSKEDSYIPWRSTFTSLTYISSMLSLDTNFALWRKFVLGIVTPSLRRLGWADVGSHNQRSLRGVLIDLACRHEDQACFANTTAQFRNWLDHGIEPAVNLKSLVYKYGIWAGSSADDWESLWERYKVEVVPQERRSLLGALAMTRTPWLLERLLDYAQEGVFIRRQDFIVVVQLVAANPAARGLLWNWVRRNWSQFVDRFTLFDRYFGQVVPYTTSNFNTDFDKGQVEEFFRKYPEAGAGARGRKQALDRIQQNIYWMTNFKPVVTKWLRHKG
ncbi:hypothetical protein C0Q70_01768 [Pomacea canaliculata]|uniref:glutamyl aminopeptidase n=2 Tax=Pomacea canaliculata TaxID=400727 RepID=A0A2T7Q0G1_POMCA|nr:hypothetical protein C0Q70_01768 [Pomacea canaliculata]